jgi:hypothetical protein
VAWWVGRWVGGQWVGGVAPGPETGQTPHGTSPLPLLAHRAAPGGAGAPGFPRTTYESTALTVCPIDPPFVRSSFAHRHDGLQKRQDGHLPKRVATGLK